MTDWMKSARLVTLMILAGQPACSHRSVPGRTENNPDPDTRSRSGRPTFCPDGHETLKDVPIAYGLLIADTPEAERELNEAIKNYEMWPGGCVSTPDSPKVKVTCTTCGFGYDAEFSSWSRSSSDRGSFTRPFSQATLAFQLISSSGLQDEIRYSQQVSLGNVRSEGISFTSRRERADLMKAVDRWFETQGIEQSFSEQQATTMDVTDNIISEWKGNEASVSLHFAKESRTSWVMLYLWRDDAVAKNRFQ
jgi:hypothetical protein